jgi:hypothetical protein
MNASHTEVQTPLQYVDPAGGHCAPIAFRKSAYLVLAKTDANLMLHASMKCSLEADLGQQTLLAMTE